MTSEVWRSVVGFEGHYEVSNLGAVRAVPKIDAAGSMRKQKLLRPRTGSDGKYHVVTLVKPGVRKHIGVHRLVALAFIPNPEGKPEVDHINRDTFDNPVSNLRWATDKEQCANRKERWDSVRLRGLATCQL